MKPTRLRPSNEVAVRKGSDDKLRRPRFFLGVRETAGYYAALADGLRELGYHARAVDLSGHPFRYQSEGWWIRVSRYLADRRSRSRGLARAVWRTLQWLLTAAVMLWAVPLHDVFVLTSLPRAAAVPTIGILRLAHKKVIVVFHGSDARPPYLDGILVRKENGPAALARATKRQRSAVRAMERWANVVVCQNGIAHFLERPFVQFISIGVPATSARGESNAPRSDAVRVVHAPSDSPTKGTAEIRRAVQTMRDEGFAIDYVELTGVSHERVLSEIERADVVIDQLYSDFPMPGFATEAASFGKPVVIAGYDWELLRLDVPDDAWPPAIQIRPEELLETLRSLATQPDSRRLAGDRARKFVLSKWHPTAVARAFVQLAAGDYPAHWNSFPGDVKAMHGYGMRPEVSRATIAGLVTNFGPDSLQLSHVPDVESRALARLYEASR
jgi:glycosyltransferase involved in cell wall biosynthesis